MQADFVNQMATSYLPGGLQALSAVIYREAVAKVAEAANLDTAAVVISDAVVAGLVLLFYMPLIRSLDAEIKRSRFLLLLIPEEVAKSVPAVVMVSRKLASE